MTVLRLSITLTVYSRIAVAAYTAPNLVNSNVDICLTCADNLCTVARTSSIYFNLLALARPPASRVHVTWLPMNLYRLTHALSSTLFSSASINPFHLH